MNILWKSGEFIFNGNNMNETEEIINSLIKYWPCNWSNVCKIATRHATNAIIAIISLFTNCLRRCDNRWFRLNCCCCRHTAKCSTCIRAKCCCLSACSSHSRFSFQSVGPACARVQFQSFHWCVGIQWYIFMKRTFWLFHNFHSAP